MDADASASNLRARTTALEYLACTGDFERSIEEGPIGPHDTLGALVAGLASGCRPTPAERQLPLLDMPLRLAVVGSTFAGKTTVAQALAKSHRLRVLDPERLIEEAVAAAAAFTAGAWMGKPVPLSPLSTVHHASQLATLVTSSMFACHLRVVLALYYTVCDVKKRARETRLFLFIIKTCKP